jgi:hypothetical protein
MRAFYTVHPTDTVDDSLHANCEQCGAFVDIARAMNTFEAEHKCGEANLYGFTEYYDEKAVAQYYGLPHWI